MEIGFKVPQTHLSWTDLRKLWLEAEATGAFDSAWLFDHFTSTDFPGGAGSLEALSAAGALAEATSRVRLGHLVLGNTYRHPVMVAKSAVTLDYVSEGRFVLGLGAGWHVADHAMLGMVPPALNDRMGMLEEATEIIKGLWNASSPFSFSGTYYTVSDAVADPKPFSEGGPSIWLGTQGVNRGLSTVARFADGWNATGSFDEFTTKKEALRNHCLHIGRDPSSIHVSAQIFARSSNAALLAEARRYARAAVDTLIFVLAPDTTPQHLYTLVKEVVEPLRTEF